MHDETISADGETPLKGDNAHVLLDLIERANVDAEPGRQPRVDV